MKLCLSDTDILNNGDFNRKIKIDEKMFLKAAVLIANDIENCYEIKENSIGILGIARGAMPLLITIAHYLDIRKISIMHIQMTNSDKIKDYGPVRFINEMLDPEVEEYIILEDIVSHGRCSNFAINRLLDYGKRIKGVYSIVMNEAFESLDYDIQNIDLKYVYKINDKQWVNFFWEKGYLD